MSELMRLRSTPLALCNGRALMSSSPADCAQRIHPSLPIQDVTLLADPTDYAHKSASLNLGCLGISIGMGSPFRFQVDDHAVVSLLLSCGGQGQLAMGGQRFVIDPERPALYLPGEAFSYQINQPHGLVITTQVERLAAQALLQGDRWFQLERLDAFNRKFLPTWEPRFAAYERTVDLPQAALAVIAAEGLIPVPKLPSFGGDETRAAEPAR
jgi:hypothetical protein